MFEPNLDRSPDRFRDLATVVAPAVLAPAFEDVHRAARRRHTRRTTIATLAVVAGVALAVSTPAIVGLRPAEPPSRGTGGPPGEKVPDYRSGGGGLTFVSPSTGYRFVSRCPNRPVPCQLTLETTGDGGRTWQRRPVPRLGMPESDGRNDPFMEVLGPRLLRLTAGDNQQLSTDGGHRWAAAPPVAEPVAAAAKSDLVYMECRTEPCTVLAIDPATGIQAPLRTQPPLAVAELLTTATDGSIWVQGRDAAGALNASVSRDGGLTWTMRAIPGLEDDAEPSFAVLTWDGRTAYAVNLHTTGTDLPTPTELPIARSDDGGLTWRRLPPAQGLVPAAMLAAAILPDGRLAISQRRPHAGLFVSSDGITFERDRGVPGLISMQAFSGGVLGEADRPLPGSPGKGFLQEPGTQPYLTTDGRTWRALPFWDSDTGN